MATNPKTKLTDSAFISGVDIFTKLALEKFLAKNNLVWKDLLEILLRMVVKRSWLDWIREGGGPEGFAQLDNQIAKYVEQEAKKGYLPTPLVERYLKVPLIQRLNHKLIPLTRQDLEGVAAEVSRRKVESVSEEVQS